MISSHRTTPSRTAVRGRGLTSFMIGGGAVPNGNNQIRPLTNTEMNSRQSKVFNVTRQTVEN